MAMMMMTHRIFLLLFCLSISTLGATVRAFRTTTTTTTTLSRPCTNIGRTPSTPTSKLFAEPEQDQETNGEVAKEVQMLLARAKAIRESLPEENQNQLEAPTLTEVSLPPSGDISESSVPSVGYRLNFDIGREEGTWMDPTWGRSGKRIEGSLDVSFQITPNEIESNLGTGEDPSLAESEIMNKMVKDNLSGKSTAVRVIDSSVSARLRGGFDKMNCSGGGYRIDIAKRGATVRFYVEVDGTEEGKGNYGDIFIPKGCLYFSLPCFNNTVKQLSIKEGIITVRQMGWHTGWRREESRIVGVFRAVPIEQARKRDKY